MTCAALAEEYTAALRVTAPADLQPLRGAGISESALAIARPALSGITVSRSGLFEPDPDSDALAFILPVRIDNPLSPEARDPAATLCGGEVVDLVAFSSAYADRWAVRTGVGTWLGVVEPQCLAPAPTPVWRSPLQWLRHNCDGVVLLSRDRPERYRVLTSLDAVVAEDTQHARELRQLLAHPWPAPPVYTRREVQNAA